MTGPALLRAPRRGQRRRVAWLAARLALSGGMLAYLATRFPFGEAAATLASAAAAGVLLAIGAKALAVPCSAAVWRAVLDPEVRLSPGQAVRTYYASLPATLAAPGNLGGDALRAAATGGLRRAHAGLAGLLAERAVIATALALAAAAGAWLSPEAAAWRVPLGGLALLASAALLAGVALGGRLAGRVHGSRFPSRVLRASLLGVHRLRARPAALAVGLGAAGLVACTSIAVAAAFAALGAPLPWAFAVFGACTAALVVMLPLSVQGLGVREGAFLALFTGLLGIPAATALAASLLSLLASVTVALLGLAALWWPATRAAPPREARPAPPEPSGQEAP